MNTIQIRRFLHKTCLHLYAKRSANPGVGYQLQGLDEDSISLTDDPEGFGDLESDFMSMQHSHRAHEAEMQSKRERIRKFVIKHKYFRDQQIPNFLTFAEKEQIRLLHARDAEEWSVERLAESFPTSPDVIKKILNAKWRPRSTNRILAHDEAVIKNWKTLCSDECKISIPPELKAHLEKFANRELSELQTQADQWPTRPGLPKPSGNEFQSIITSSKNYAHHDKNKEKLLNAISEQPVKIVSKDEETYLLGKVQNKRKMRLQELKQTKLIPNENSNSLSSENPSNPSGTGIMTKIGTSNLSSFIQKFESIEVVISAADQKHFETSSVKDKIHIPRKLWKKGATYRVEDVYYDDDGKLLYRVPGLTKQ